MKYINKIYTLALMAAVAFGFSACADSEDYTPADKVAGMEVYFSGVNSTTKKDLSSKENTFSIPVNRIKTAEAANVAIDIQIPEGSKISCASPSVSFAAGASQGNLELSYKPEEMDFDHYDTIHVAIKDVNSTSPYGVSEFTLIAGIPAPWLSLGAGELIEDFFWGFKTKVEIFQNQVEPSLYRIENVFEPEGDNASPWLYFKVLKAGDTVLDQTIPEDDMVYFYGDGEHDSFNTGVFNTTYNADICLVFPGTFKSLGDPTDWMQNKVLAYQEDGSIGAIQLAPEYYMFGVGGWGGSESDGDIIISFPGYTLADYEAEIDVVGRLIDKKENGQAVFDITLGEDVASAKVAMAPGKGTEDAAYKLIQDEDPSVVEITSSQEVRIPYEEPGYYTVIVVTYDADGKEQKFASSNINIPENGEPKEIFEAVFTGIYSHCVKSLDGEGPMWEDYDSEDGMLYVSNLDEDRCMISPWVNLGYEEIGTEGEGMIFIWDEEDNITVPECFTGVTDSKYGDIWAWDVITAQVEDAEDMASYFDDETGTINFFLAWSCSYGDFSYTMDTFELTGFAEAGAKKRAAKYNKGIFGKKFSNFKLPLINNGAKKVKKVHKPFTTNATPSKNLKLKK